MARPPLQLTQEGWRQVRQFTGDRATDFFPIVANHAVLTRPIDDASPDAGPELSRIKQLI